MGRYPTRQGIALDPREVGFEVVPFERRRTSQHHLYYTRAMYRSPIETIFRGLITNVFTLEVPEHNRLHERYKPPIKPNDIIMQDVIEEYISLNGVIDVVRERHTHTTYQVTQEQWHLLRGNREIPEAYQRANRVA